MIPPLRFAAQRKDRDSRCRGCHASTLKWEFRKDPLQEQLLVGQKGTDLEALAQVAQRSCGCPLPGRVQGQVGWSSEQPGLVEDVPADGKGVEPDDL